LIHGSPTDKNSQKTESELRRQAYRQREKEGFPIHVQHPRHGDLRMAYTCAGTVSNLFCRVHDLFDYYATRTAMSPSRLREGLGVVGEFAALRKLYRFTLRFVSRF
jgi:hypothetical protein